MNLFKASLMPVFLCVFAAVFGTSCSASYTASVIDQKLAATGLRDTHTYERLAEWRISPRSKVSLKLAHPEAPLLPRTTRQLNKTLVAEIGKYFPHNVLIESDSLDENLSDAYHQGCDILIVAKLVGVKNKLNTRHELSMGKAHYPERDWGRDELTMRFYIYEARTHRLLDLISVKSEARYLKHIDSIALNLIEDSVQYVFAGLTSI